jgi:hypothetical protein
MTRDPDDRVRACAVQELGSAIYPDARRSPSYSEAREAVSDALFDHSPLVRLGAAWLLMNDPEWGGEAHRTFEGCLHDPTVGEKAEELLQRG